MSQVPSDLRYTKDHEWIKVEKKRGRVGITDYAQSQLTDVVYVDLPKKGQKVSKGKEMATVESVKAVSEIYAPVDGAIVEVNQALEDKPEIVNKEPYGGGWIAVLEVQDPKQVDGLMTADQYRKHIGEA